MKKLLLFILLIVSPLIGQEKEETRYLKSLYQKRNYPIFVLATYNLGIVSPEQIYQKDIRSYINIDLEIDVNISFRPDLYSAFLYSRYGGNFSFYKKPQLGFAVGISGYLFDKRSYETGIGWAMMIGAGFAANYGFEDETIDSGIETFIRTQYNFHKYVGVVFGLSFQYFLSFDERWATQLSAKDNNKLNALLIGINLGLAF